MTAQASPIPAFDNTDPTSIYDYSQRLIGKSLHDLFGDKVLEHTRKGKGGMGQMVEELFFNYSINSKREADFEAAKLELKCTPLLSDGHQSYRIKERLVCTMIDYFSLVETPFETSHLLAKCRLMLLLFYLHEAGKKIYDLEFIFRVLWELPEKDLLQIKHDYETIASKVRNGEAHLLSEGDTLYLGACRKGQKGDSPQPQPFSEIRAKKRAFSLKPAYMRYVLSHVLDTPDHSFSNLKSTAPTLQLVTQEDLRHSHFEQIIIDRFKPYLGLNYTEICQRLDMAPYQSKNKYADISGLIASAGKSKRISKSDEFIKSGIIMKTIRVNSNETIKESMSFKNIDYQEIFDNDSWTESELYEIFTSRFMFVVFKQKQDATITIPNNQTGELVTENAYILDNVFFWTMPPSELKIAEEYWKNIRQNVLSNNIGLNAFWKISDNSLFHVRPKATCKAQKAPNPNGGLCDKYCYWFNAQYIKQIIDNNTTHA